MTFGVVALALVTAGAPHGEIAARTDAIEADLVELRRDLHRHPELANREISAFFEDLR